MKTNEIQNELKNKLSEFGANWWGRGETPERLYFNAQVMKGLKVWIQFADAGTLAGAQVRARWTGAEQHPNWIATTEKQWADSFSEKTLGAVAEAREQFELSADQENEVLEAKAERKAEIQAAVIEAVEMDIADAKIEKSITRAGATEFSEIETRFGNVEIMDGVPANFRHVKFSEAFKFLISTKTKATENKWLKAARKAADCRPAVTGFFEKSVGQPGHTRDENFAIIDGVICKAGDESKIEAAVAELENEAQPLLKTEAYGKSLLKIPGSFFVGQRAPGFKMMQPGEIKTSGSGKTTKCLVNGEGWYVACQL